MIKNYLKIAWRNLWRNRVFSSINIAGPGIGMAVSFTLILYVLFQFSLWTYLSAGVIAIVVARLTVSIQSVKAASMSPEKVLRTE
jgi:hypothetical protein